MRCEGGSCGVEVRRGRRKREDKSQQLWIYVQAVLCGIWVSLLVERKGKVKRSGEGFNLSEFQYTAQYL